MESFLMKNLIVCVAFFAIAIGLSNVSMAECGLRDRVACVGCKAKVAVKRMSRSAMCRVQSVKSRTVKAVKSAPCRVRRGVNKVMQARPRVMGCCEVSSVAVVPATLVIPVAVMPKVNELLIIKN
jgi:hypothetical protein